MSRPLRSSTFAVAILLCVVIPPRALACSCTGPVPFPQALARANTAFIGEVVTVRYKASLPYRAAMRLRELLSGLTGSSDPGLQEWYRSPFYGRVAEIRVGESFKGERGPTIKVHFGHTDDCMSYPFVVGEKYLVFAYLGDEEGPAGHQRLEVNSCGMTRPLAEAKEALDELRGSAGVRLK